MSMSSNTRAAQHTGTPNASHGSVTLTASQAGPSTLRLRAEPEERRRIQWAEDVVDNEGMGKKRSKVCCIYHKPREAGESSDESSSSSSDDSDSEPDTSRAQPANRRRHTHDHGSKGKQTARKPSPNAYERLPKKRDHVKD